jgi:hypothetical protein
VAGKRPFKTLAERTSRCRPEAGTHHRLDLDDWLKRGAHIAQLCLVVIAVFGYFFTVRPIYQKERLDEDIARETLELKPIKSRLDLVYARLRSGEIHFFVGSLDIDCSGLMTPTAADPSRHRSFSQMVMSTDTAECIRKHAQDHKRLPDLSAADINAVMDQVNAAASEIAELQIKEAAELERLKVTPPESLPPVPPDAPGSTAAEIEQVLEDAGLRVARDSPTARLDHALTVSANGYLKRVRERMMSIEDHWTPPKPIS